VGPGTDAVKARVEGGGLMQKVYVSAKRHPCPYCPYSSCVATNWRNHMRTHTGEKPFKCPHCSYSAITKDNLKRHIRSHAVPSPL
ncbi:hypothetical protein SK128_001311, partial [Halocaridina rubra]